VDAEGFIEERREEVPSRTYDLRIELTRRIPVDVTLLDEHTREPIRDYRAEVWTVDAENGLVGRRGGGRRCVRDEHASTMIENLDMGACVVRVEAEEYSRAQTPSFVLEPGMESPQFELLAYAAARFAGVVTGGDTVAPLYIAVVALAHLGNSAF